METDRISTRRTAGLKMFNPPTARILIHPLKTALAALVAALTCEAFGLSQPLWLDFQG